MGLQKPLKYTCQDNVERIAEAMKANRCFDTEPGDLDRKAFELRRRDPSKEIHPSFKLRSHSSVERLEDKYD